MAHFILFSKLNTNFEDVTSKFNWGASTEYKAVRIGKVIFFRATCTTKSATEMTFVTMKDAALYPVAFTPLDTYTLSGADFTRRAVAYVLDNTIKLQTHVSYASAERVALTGNVAVSGCWIIK